MDGNPATTDRGKRSVVNVHTFRSGLARTTAGLARIPHVSDTSQCYEGLESRSSPTSGTAYPLVRGGFALTCVHSGWSGPSDTGRGVSLAPRVACLVVGERAQGRWLVGPPLALNWSYVILSWFVDGLHSGDDSYAVPWPAGLFGAVLEFEGKGLGRFEAVLGGEHHLGIVCGELLSGLGGAGWTWTGRPCGGRSTFSGPRTEKCLPRWFSTCIFSGSKNGRSSCPGQRRSRPSCPTIQRPRGRTLPRARSGRRSSDVRSC